MSRRKCIPGKFASGNLKCDKPIHQEYLEILLLKMMRDACLDPAVIFAYETTLYWITDNNEAMYSRKQLASWDKALREFTERNK